MDSQQCGVLVVSPEGTVCYWPNMIHESSPIETCTGLVGQECHSLLEFQVCVQKIVRICYTWYVLFWGMQFLFLFNPASWIPTDHYNQWNSFIIHSEGSICLWWKKFPIDSFIFLCFQFCIEIHFVSAFSSTGWSFLRFWSKNVFVHFWRNRSIIHGLLLLSVEVFEAVFDC